MTDPHLAFFSGLLWYLEARNWALEKIKSCPHGSHLFDVQMYHALYFTNLVSAFDHVSDHLKDDKAAQQAFIFRIESGFGDTGNWEYVRELRNAIIHRGLNPTSAAHGDGTSVFALCPVTIQNRWHKKSHTCTFRYMVELAGPLQSYH
ncbi:hypothetical protein [Rhodopila sp.]|uniref:hypothetical protein n=1 Tax=Rhodopila sp. TaxID=2480087 RepID=UPI003D0B644B